MNKLNSFTMAEVLITLGIIGIVAAMTLPSVINKSQKFILKQQFKKAYSILAQALLKSEADLGYSPLCYYNATQDVSSSTGYKGGGHSEECSVLQDAMLKNLNVIQKCESNAYANHCIPEYIGLEKVFMQNDPDMSEEEAKDKIKGFLGWSTTNILNRNQAYILQDGIIIIAYYAIPFPYNFAVEVNGKKGPNKWGYDLFPFITVANSKTNLIILGYGGYPVERGGVSTPEMIRQMHNK